MAKKIEISPFGLLLVYKKGYTCDFVRKIICNRDLRGLRIFADLKRDQLSSIDFLREYDFLEVLSITSVNDFDFSFLSNLQQLKELSIHVFGRNIIDLRHLTNLQTLSIDWRKNIKGIESCQKLQEICLVDYKEKDLSPIKALKNLKKIMIKTASIKNLLGLEDMKSLQHLLLGNCRSLRSIGAINGLKSLKILEIITCSKIEDYESLTNLPHLETLRIIDCRGLETIKFVKNIPKLTELTLTGNTNVLDGDMTPALGIRKVTTAHRRHYNIKIGR